MGRVGARWDTRPSGGGLTRTFERMGFRGFGRGQTAPLEFMPKAFEMVLMPGVSCGR